MVRHLHVVPHTHWDREWYEPFPVFRARLVELLDEVLDRLDGSDPAHPLEHFQLDGQMAMVDDYLEVRPAERDRIQQLAGAGRLSMGPWYVLPDEFLVSGETLVRNLQLGMARADELGTPMPVGYLPDMFGHIAAMPQLLTLFDMRDAVVWRGVPASVRSPAFDWRSPDGSVVRAEYLSGGYFNGSDMPADPAELADRVALFAASQGSLVGDRVLWLAGMDHEVPPPHLATTVAGLAGVDDRETPDVVTIGPLTEAFVDVERDGLPVHDGELRSGARANLLMGVASNRVDVKAAAATAERSLERLAEPLDALWQHDDRWAPLLRIAWREVIRNAAHDSICACSHDEVVDAVLHRYAEATRTANEVAGRALDRAAASFATPGTYLVNPTQHARDELVTVTVDASSVDPTTMQVIDREPDSEVLHRGGAGEAPLLLARELLFERPAVRAARLVPVEGTDDDHLRVELHEGVRPDELEGGLAPADALGEVGRRCDHDPEIVVSTVLHRARPRATALADVRSGRRVRLASMVRTRTGPPRRGDRRHDPRERPDQRDRRPRRRNVLDRLAPRSRPPRRRRRRRRHLQLVPAPARPGGRGARTSSRCTPPRADRCGDAWSSTPSTSCPNASGTTRTAGRAARAASSSGSPRPSSSAQRSRSSGSPSSWATTCATTGCGPTCHSPVVRPPRPPSAPSDWCSVRCGPRVDPTNGVWRRSRRGDSCAPAG